MRASANWSLLIQCLQQLILGEKVVIPSQDTPPVSESEVSEQTQVLDLALEVLAVGDFHQRWEIAKVFPKLGQSAIAAAAQTSRLKS